MGFRREALRSRLRLRGFLVVALLMAAVAGRLVGKALLFTVEPELHYDLGEAVTPPVWWRDYPNHVAAALMLLVWVQYMRMRARGDLLVLALVGARPLHERRLANTAAEMAIAAGLKAPRLYVMEDPSLNAFACGARDRSAIVVTRGLLEHLDRDELQGVLAHETAHIRNGDTLLMTALFGLSRVFGMTASFALGPLAAIWALSRVARSAEPVAQPEPHPRPRRRVSPWMAVALIAGIPVATVLCLALALAVSLGLFALFVLVVRYLPWLAVALAAWELWKLAGDPERERQKPRRLSALLALSPAGLIVGPAILLVGCLFPFLFWMLRLAVSRNQEFLADATAVELTRYPDGLASALRKLHADSARPTSFPRCLSPLAIASVGAARRRDGAGWPAFARALFALFSTHPPLQERIARLERIGAGADPSRDLALMGFAGLQPRKTP